MGKGKHRERDGDDVTRELDWSLGKRSTYRCVPDDRGTQCRVGFGGPQLLRLPPLPSVLAPVRRRVTRRLATLSPDGPLSIIGLTARRTPSKSPRPAAPSVEGLSCQRGSIPRLPPSAA